MARKKNTDKAQEQTVTAEKPYTDIKAQIQNVDYSEGQDQAGADFSYLENAEVVPTRNPLISEGDPDMDTFMSSDESSLEDSDSVDTAPEETQDTEERPEQGKPINWEERYKNLETKLGEQGAELGQYRQFFDQHVMQNKQQQSQSFNDLGDDEFSEEFFNNPKQVMTKTKEEMKRELFQEMSLHAQKQSALHALEKAHPDRMEVVNSSEFRDFVLKEIPRSVAIQGDTDPEVAGWILSQYKTKHNNNGNQAEAVRKIATKRESVKHASPISTTPKGSDKPMFTRYELMQMMVNEPDKYEMMQPQIQKAYREGRVK